jgi:hypothetical protein
VDEYVSKTKVSISWLAIQNFLKLKRVDLVEKHQKLNSDKLSDLVENYDEVAILLKNTQYGKYLDIPAYD